MGCARPACDALVARRRCLPGFRRAAAAVPHRARLRRTRCRGGDSGNRRVRASSAQSSAASEATIVQHGYAHRNHAPAGERSAELGSHRALDACLAELEQGRDALQRLFGRSIHAGARSAVESDRRRSRRGALPSAGLHGVSCFGPRATAMPSPHIVQANTHVDLIAWRRDRAFHRRRCRDRARGGAFARAANGRRRCRRADGHPDTSPGPRRRCLRLHGDALRRRVRSPRGGVARRKRVFAAPATRVTSARSA